MEDTAAVDTLPGPGSNFSAALTAWKDISLGNLQKKLDAQGLEIVENQKENMVGRKKLAEQTRDFKKIAEEEKANAFKGLLKAYQSEIDNLTKRSKTAENAFLSVYKVLAEAPDPFPLLDAAVDQTAKASEARLFEAELARERQETASLRQQLQDAQSIEKERKKLAERCEKYEQKMEDMISEKVDQKEAELHATYDERLRNYEDRERDLTKQVTMSREQLRDLRNSHESTHAKLLDNNQRQDQESMARQTEMDLMAADVERANSRVLEMERRNEKLRAEIESVRNGSENEARVRTLESQTSDLQSETARLIQNLEDQKIESERNQKQDKKSIQDRDTKLVNLTNELSSLRERVQQFADYDEIKRELDIMKFVEFSGTNLDDETEIDDGSTSNSDSVIRMPDPNADKANQNRGRPLENLLLGKNRKIQEQLTVLRVAHEDLITQTDAVKSECEQLRAQVSEQQQLNDRLENDLLNLNRSNGPSAGPSGTATPSQGLDSLASLNIGKKEAPAVAAPGLTSTAESSILPIITSQRDRFRQRNSEIEEELRKSNATTAELRTETKALQADNMKLYEKVRYLQSYRQDAGPSNSLYPAAPAKEKNEDLGKYRNLYEQSMNPFEAFRGRERSTAVQALNPIEKLLYGFANLILGNRYMRGLFVIYAALLHLFIFLTLWGSISSPSRPHQARVAQAPP